MYHNSTPPQSLNRDSKREMVCFYSLTDHLSCFT
nr:MAG TPA: hypothetical protein [Caudoviricetes sp.]